jgi:hypothetical protein
MKRIIVAFSFIVALLSMAIVITAADTSNLSGYGFATSDTYEDQGTIALAAVDGVVHDESRWISSVSVKLDEEKELYCNTKGKTSWLQIEFEKSTEIVSANIYWAKEKAAEGYYKLQYSDDGENWTEVNDCSLKRNEGDGSALNPCIDYITFDAVKAIYYRVEISAGETKDGLGSIYEFELNGDPTQYDFIRKNINSNEPSVQSSGQSKSTGNTTMIIAISVGAVLVVMIILMTLKTAKKIKGELNKND